MTLFIKREMIGQLIELNDRYRDEAGRCADAGAFQAATVMLAIAFEAKLFCTIAMSQHVLEPAGYWPTGDPFKWELGRLLACATQAGWFSDEPALEEVIPAINEVRISSVHPAAYIRDGARFHTERELEAIYRVLEAATTALARVVEKLPPPAEGVV